MVILKPLGNILLLLYFIYTRGELRLEVYNNGPVILDSQITFTAYLEGQDDSNDNIYIFQDNTDIAEVHEIRGGNNVTFMYTYRKSTYKGGNYLMKVRMKNKRFRKLSNHTLFTLSETVPGNIIFHQDGLPPDESCSDCVSSNRDVNLTAVIHDPSGYFHNASFLYYIWIINERSFLAEETVSYQFSNAGEQQIEVMIVVVVNGIPNLGNLKQTLNVKDPIGNLNITGKLALPHGQIFNVNVTCNGSGPYQYCLKLFKPNETAVNATCEDIIMTTSCIISYQHYLPVIGSYHLLISLSNDVNTKKKVIDVEVFDISHKPLLSAMIIPVVCSIIVIIIIAAGIVYHALYRKSHTVEVADFDFQQEDEWVERTFFEHICDSLKKKAFSHKFSSRNKGPVYNSCQSQDEISPLINSHLTS